METTTETATAASTEAASTTQPSTPAAPSETSSSSEPSWLDSLDKAIAEGQISLKEGEGAEKEASETTDKSTDKSEKATDDDDVAPANMSPKAADSFKAIKQAKKAAEARVADLEAKLKEVESAPKPDAAQAEALQEAIKERETKIAEYEKELAISRYEATPEYKENVVKPLAAIFDVAERIAAKYKEQGVTPKKLQAVLEESDPDRQGEMIEELAGSFKERDRVTLYNLADDFSAVMAERDSIRERAQQALEVREKQAKEAEARQLAEARSNWTKSTKKVWDTIKSKVPLPLEGDELSRVEQEIVGEVEKLDFGSLSDDVKAFAALSGATIPHIVRHNKALEAKVAELEIALKKYQQSSPGADAGNRVDESDLGGDLDFLSAIERKLR